MHMMLQMLLNAAAQNARAFALVSGFSKKLP